MAWTTSNNLLTRNGSDILEYSLTQNAVHQGTNIHGAIATHTIAGLSTTGYGMTKGLDGWLYTPTSTGLQRFNPNNWATPAQSLAATVGGQGYGITTLPDGRIAYVAGSGTNDVYLYNPSNGNNTLIYSAPGLIDDIEASSSGAIALAGQTNSNIIIISNTGSVINSFRLLTILTAWLSVMARGLPRCSAITMMARSLSTSLGRAILVCPRSLTLPPVAVHTAIWPPSGRIAPFTSVNSTTTVITAPRREWVPIGTITLPTMNPRLSGFPPSQEATVPKYADFIVPPDVCPSRPACCSYWAASCPCSGEPVCAFDGMYFNRFSRACKYNLTGVPSLRS